MKFLIGQRVIVGGEICTVAAPPEGSWSQDNKVWVFRPSKGFASEFDIHNVKPLPNGQL